MRRLLTAMALTALAVPALADPTAVLVAVGTTTERNVGNAHGWFCDDPTLVDARIETRNDENVWVVKGTKTGTTQCRVGTDSSRASFVFDVTVIAAPKKKR